MLAAFCDGCMDEIVSNDKAELISWVAAHYDHYRTWSMKIAPTVSVDPVLGIRQHGILQR